MESRSFRVATADDADILARWPIRFHYRNTVAEELSGTNAGCFRWLLYERDGRPQAFHRCVIVAGWAEWAGVHSQGLTIDGRVLAQLASHVADDLAGHPLVNGQFAWSNDPSSAKAVFLRRLGFEQYPMDVHRMVFSAQSLAALTALGTAVAKDRPEPGWRLAGHADAAGILALTRAAPCFIELFEEPRFDGFTQWLIKDGDSGPDAAICWWQHGQAIEVHFTCARAGVLDITAGIIHLAHMSAAGFLPPVRSVRISIDGRCLLTVLRLLALRPIVYSPTSGVSLFRRLDAAQELI